MDKIAVLIPCYNEEMTIYKVVSDFKRVLPEAVVYVYDNNSKDRTVEEALRAGAVVRREYKQGKGNVIRRMFREIDAQCYVMTDGDDTYPAEDAPEMVRMVLERGSDMVVGDRLSSTYFTENKRPFHNFGNSLVRKMINVIFHTDIKDIMTGYRDRPQGSESKLNTISDGTKVLRTIVRLFRDYKPMSFFGILAGMLAVLAIAFFIPVFVEYTKTGLVSRFPTLFMCGFTMLAAIQAFFAGMILQTMKMKNLQDFEMELHHINTRYAELMEKE